VGSNLVSLDENGVKAMPESISATNLGSFMKKIENIGSQIGLTENIFSKSKLN